MVLWKDKTHKPLCRFIKDKKKWDRNQMNKIRNEKGEVATNTSKIHRIISDYYEQLYVNKMYSLEEADTFLERNNLPDLN